MFALNKCEYEREIAVNSQRFSKWIKLNEMKWKWGAAANMNPIIACKCTQYNIVDIWKHAHTSIHLLTCFVSKLISLRRFSLSLSRALRIKCEHVSVCECEAANSKLKLHFACIPFPIFFLQFSTRFIEFQSTAFFDLFHLLCALIFRTQFFRVRLTFFDDSKVVRYDSEWERWPVYIGNKAKRVRVA